MTKRELFTCKDWGHEVTDYAFEQIYGLSHLSRTQGKVLELTYFQLCNTFEQEEIYVKLTKQDSMFTQ